jgi:sugar phosphate isomerase/epimerase
MGYAIVGARFRHLPLDDFLKGVRELGCEGFELYVTADSHGGIFGECASPRGEPGLDNLAPIRRRIEQAGLCTIAIGGMGDFVQTNTTAMQQQAEQVKWSCDVAVALGCEVVRTFGGEPKEGADPADWEQLIARGYELCLPHAESRGVILAMENHGFITNDGDLEMRLLDRLGSPNFRLTLDTSNYRWFGHDLDTIRRWFDKLAPFVAHTHLKDGSVQSGTRREYTALSLGEGEAPIAFAVQRLREAGFNRPWCVEYEGRLEPMLGLERGLRFLRGIIEDAPH